MWHRLVHPHSIASGVGQVSTRFRQFTCPQLLAPSPKSTYMTAARCFASGEKWVPPPTVLQRTVCHGDDSLSDPSLRLVFLGCEEQAPTGPYLHTANLFLDLMTRALELSGQEATTIQLQVYAVSSGQFPSSQVLDDCHGVILPGAYSSAYDQKPWIGRLAQFIQDELVAKEKPTMAVCFGHQIYAHSFPLGNVVTCPAGAHGGRVTAQLTSHGRTWLRGGSEADEDTSNLALYYTHSDMVEKLPPQAKVLASTDDVPIQAAIYFATNATDTNRHDKPIAVTLQAHPEYGSSMGLGLEQTVMPELQVMRDCGEMDEAEFQRAREDAKVHFQSVERQSIQTMLTVGKLLGWFPTS